MCTRILNFGKRFCRVACRISDDKVIGYEANISTACRAIHAADIHTQDWPSKKMRAIKARKWECRFSGVSHCGAAAKVPDAPTSKSATHDALETRARPDESRTTPLSIHRFSRFPTIYELQTNLDRLAGRRKTEWCRRSSVRSIDKYARRSLDKFVTICYHVTNFYQCCYSRLSDANVAKRKYRFHQHCSQLPQAVWERTTS